MKEIKEHKKAVLEHTRPINSLLHDLEVALKRIERLEQSYCLPRKWDEDLKDWV